MPRNLSILLGVAMRQMYTNVMRANFTRKKGTCFAPTSGAAHQPPSASPAAQGLGDCLGVLSRSVSWKCWMYFASADSRPCPEDTGSLIGISPTPSSGTTQNESWVKHVNKALSSGCWLLITLIKPLIDPFFKKGAPLSA